MLVTGLVAVSMLLMYAMGFVAGLSWGRRLKREEIARGLDLAMANGTLVIYERKPETREVAY